MWNQYCAIISVVCLAFVLFFCCRSPIEWQDYCSSIQSTNIFYIVHLNIHSLFFCPVSFFFCLDCFMLCDCARIWSTHCIFSRVSSLVAYLYINYIHTFLFARVSHKLTSHDVCTVFSTRQGLSKLSHNVLGSYRKLSEALN